MTEIQIFAINSSFLLVCRRGLHPFFPKDFRWYCISLQKNWYNIIFASPVCTVVSRHYLRTGHFAIHNLIRHFLALFRPGGGGGEGGGGGGRGKAKVQVLTLNVYGLKINQIIPTKRRDCFFKLYENILMWNIFLHDIWHFRGNHISQACLPKLCKFSLN